MDKIKVYLSARISKDAHKWNNYICDSLKYPISIFIPQDHNPLNISHDKFPKEVYDMDIEAMEESHLALLLPEYGCDCAYEVGWYANSNKPLVVYLDNQINWLKDWMVKGGVDYVITTNQKTWKILMNDPILKYKPVIFIEDISKLNEEIIRIFRRHYKC